MRFFQRLSEMLFGGWRFVGEVEQPWTWQMRRKVNGKWEYRPLTESEYKDEVFFEDIVFRN
jgi:hypothetical protein